MTFLLALLRLALAGIFIVAGLTKLRHLQRTREDFAALGLPAWIVPTASVLLPIIELAVAAMLLIQPLADLGAGCALGLLGLFAIVIAFNLWRGRHPACACFGSLSRSRIGAGTLLRNILLMAAAGTLLIPPSAIPAFDVPSTTSALVIASMLVGCVILFQAWWVLQLSRQQGRLLLRIEQLEQVLHMAPTPEPEPVTLPRSPELAGQLAPALTLHDVAGRRISLQALRGRPTLLLFFDASCQHCRPLLKRLHTWQPATQVIVFVAGVAGGQSDSVEPAPGITVVADEAPSAMQTFGVMGTPAAILIDADGTVAEPTARGAAAVNQLLDRLTAQPPTQLQEVHHELAPV